MTTLCWDGKTLACDSRVTAGTRIISNSYKKLFRLNSVEYRDDILYAAGLCGSLSDFVKILDFLEMGALPDEDFTHEAGILIVGSKRVYRIEEGTSYLIPYDYATQLASGSGASYAFSAMKLGLNAKDAVKHAINIDSASGGKVQIIDMKEI